jgi:hypothetical protein
MSLSKKVLPPIQILGADFVSFLKPMSHTSFTCARQHVNDIQIIWSNQFTFPMMHLATRIGVGISWKLLGPVEPGHLNSQWATQTSKHRVTYQCIHIAIAGRSDLLNLGDPKLSLYSIFGVRLSRFNIDIILLVICVSLNWSTTLSGMDA